MRFGPVAIADAVGAILAHATNAGDKRFRKAHLLSAADVAELKSAGVGEVIAAILDQDDLGENDAATRIAQGLGDRRRRDQAGGDRPRQPACPEPPASSRSTRR